MTQKVEEADDGRTVEDRLESGWKDLDDSQREDYETQADQAMAKYKKDKDEYDEAKEKEDQEREAEKLQQEAASAQDVEMGNYDTDQETTQGGGEKGEE